MSEMAYSHGKHYMAWGGFTVADWQALTDHLVGTGALVCCEKCEGRGRKFTGEWHELPDGFIKPTFDTCKDCNGRGYTAAETKGEGE